ncbi:MAG TPA: diacylglycerol kinase family protein [Bryobacteraceae bacterium]|nr:diacylglycerol kinase family protein [Bryobacteraceae bacterium]
MSPVAGTGKAVIFVNASSGFDAKEDAPQKLVGWFGESGMDAQIHYVEKGVNLADETRQAVAAGAELVVAGGGDGTLSAVAAGLAGTDVSFGVLPVGTLNHFARDLGLPLDLEQAARIICRGRTAYVDVAEVNGKTFLNNAILGLYPIFRFLRAEEERKGLPGKLALAVAAFRALWRYPFFRLRFLGGKREIVRRTAYVLIASNKHAMKGWNLGKRETLHGGKLWIYVMRPQTRFGLFWMLLRLALGRFRGREYFDIFSTEEVWVDMKSRRLGVALDGEIHVMETPLHFRTLPRALRVVVP